MKCKTVELYVEFYETICLHILEQIYFITITVSHINIQYERTYMYMYCTVYSTSDERTIKCLNYTDILEFNYYIFLKGCGFNYIKYIFF
jgi:hypothetical protein